MLLTAAAFADPSATEGDVAEWALRSGGRITLDGGRVVLSDVSQLPSRAFHITGLDLAGTTIDPQSLAIISGLSSLQDLVLPGPSWTPSSDSELDANDSLKYLAGLHTLQRLSFNLHFLPTYNVQDAGLAHLQSLTDLQELRLAQSSVVKPDLTPFVHLQSLDLNDSMFTDEGMKTLAGLKDLRRLYLRNTAVTDQGLSYLRNSLHLEELNLYGVRVTDEGLNSLRNLTAMRKLNLLGAEIDDSGVAVLQHMPDLREINLYRSHITNSGLAQLAALKGLASLDVRYSRVTQSGVEELQAAIPKCKIELVGGSGAPITNGKASNPADSSPAAIAAWVKALGGTAELAGPNLKSISLVGTLVSDRQLAYLSHLASLEHLDLSATDIGDIGVSSLASLTGLKELILNNTSVSDAGLMKIAGLRHLRQEYESTISARLLREYQALLATRQCELSAASASSTIATAPDDRGLPT